METRVRSVGKKGFTLIELMTVVVIIGVLAATAMPMLSKYIRKSKTSEVAVNLRKIYDGNVIYYVTERVATGGTLFSKMFADVGYTPDTSTLSNNKRLGSWDADGWVAVKFNPDGPVLYSYAIDSSGSGRTAAFTARAVGDIDKDTKTSRFERIGSVNSSTGEVQGGAAIYMLDELE